MRIIDTYADIVSLLNGMDAHFETGPWEKYVRHISDGLLKKIKEDSNRYHFDNEILPVIRFAMNNMEKIKTAHHSFLAVIEGLEGKIKEITGTELQVDIVFYLGLCNGAGWATKLNGRRVILLGIEKIVELDWCDAGNMASLIYHELGHIWHDTVGAPYQETNSMREKYVSQLYQEGVAMYLEQLLAGDLTHYHQNTGNWLDWCYTNKHEVDAEYLRRLQANESAQDFFGDWCDYKGYSDVGYFIGCEFVKYIAKEHSLNELANLDIATVYKKFAEYIV